MNNERTKNLTK